MKERRKEGISKMKRNKEKGTKGEVYRKRGWSRDRWDEAMERWKRRRVDTWKDMEG